MRRRAFLAALGAGATAGCAAPGVRVDSGTRTGSYRTIAGERLDQAEFRAYVDARREAYGDHGVWGASGPPGSLDGLRFVGAWTRDVALPEGRSDHAVAVYAHPGSMGADRRYRAWCWSGARGARRLDHRLSLSGPVLSRAPRETLSEDGGTVAVGIDGGVRFPLAGALRPAPGDADFGVAWVGAGPVASLRGAVEYRATGAFTPIDGEVAVVPH